MTDSINMQSRVFQLSMPYFSKRFLTAAPGGIGAELPDARLIFQTCVCLGHSAQLLKKLFRLVAVQAKRIGDTAMGDFTLSDIQSLQ